MKNSLHKLTQLILYSHKIALLEKLRRGRKRKTVCDKTHVVYIQLQNYYLIGKPSREYRDDASTVQLGVQRQHSLREMFPSVTRNFPVEVKYNIKKDTFCID